jgi:hypothetical protein
MHPRCLSEHDVSRVTEIATASPPGLIQSDLFESLSSRQWSINITWTPGTEMAGLNIFCYMHCCGLCRVRMVEFPLSLSNLLDGPVSGCLDKR